MKLPEQMLMDEINAAIIKHAALASGGWSLRIIQTALAEVLAAYLVQAPSMAREPALSTFMGYVRKRIEDGISEERMPRPQAH